METQRKPEIAVELERRQQLAGWDDMRMAKHLCISIAMWYALRSGRRDMGAATLRAILRRYPDMENMVLAYLSDPEAMVTESVEVA